MLPDEGDSKAATCVDKAFEIWKETKEQKSAQLIFCDLSTPKGDGTFNMDEKGDDGIGMDDDTPEQGTERTEAFGQNVQKSERVADKPVQRVSLKERLAEMKIKATGNIMENSGNRDKRKEEFL